MKKRALSLLLCLVFLVGLMPTTALAAGGATDTWAVKLNVSQSDAYTYNGQKVLALGFGAQSDNLTLKTSQSMILAVDLEVFDLLKYTEDYSNIENATSDLTTSLVTANTPVKEGTLIIPGKLWGAKAAYAKSADGKLGYIQMQASQDLVDDKVVTEKNLMTMYIGFKSEKSVSDLQENSIRLINAAECATLNQTSAIEVTNGKGGMQQAIKKDGSTDTLTIPPEVVWNGIKPSEPAKPELKGSVTIDKTSPKFNDKLTAQTGSLDFNGAASGTLTYQWYRGTEKIDGATEATYTTIAADMNNPIKVEVMNSNNSSSVFSVETNKVAKAAGPAAPAGLAEVSKTDTTITVTSNAAWEYSIDGGGKWQDSNVFTGLTANTTYDKIVARVKTTDTHEASTACTAISVTTAKGSADSGLQATLKNSHTPYTGTYDGKAHPAFSSVATLPTGWTATYSRTETGTYSSTMPTVTNVTDSGKIYVKFSHNDYADVCIDYIVTVNKADYTFTPTGTATASVGTAKPTSASATATGVNSETVSGMLTWYTDAECKTPASGNFEAAGTVDLWWKFVPEDTATNYDTTPKTDKVTYTVSNLPAQEVAFANATVTKNFGDGKFTETATNSTSGGGAITYSGNNNAVATVDSSTGEVTIVGVGTVTITATAAEVPTQFAETKVTYELTVSAKKITPVVTLSQDTYEYDGTDKKPTVTVEITAGGDKLDAADYTVEYADNRNAGSAKVTVKPVAGRNYTWTPDAEKNFTITQATHDALADKNISHKYTLSGEQSVDLSGLVSGAKSYTLGAATGTTTIISASSVDGSVVKYTLTGTGAAGNSVTLPVTISSTNYKDATVKVVITLTDKDSPTVSANDITTTYDGNAIPDSKITGTATFGGTSVPGTWAWKTGMAVTNVADTGTKTVTFNPTDSAAYESVDTNITVTINKATPTGEPTYTKITTGGKKLSDAALASGSITPAGGTIAWDLGDTADVTANTAYGWTYNPTDTANYNPLKGSITPYVVSYSGGGSYTPTYAITVDKAANGTVTAAPGTAKTGDTVTLTATPDKGYELDTIKALDKDGKELKLTDQGNGKYTFTMPAGKVTVKAAFEDSNLVKFDDVSKGDYCYEAVKWAVKNGITSGIGNNRFGPNDPCTRGQIVTFLWRAAGSPEPKSMSSFSDVPADSYYAKAVAWAVEKGITSGTGDGKFSPEDPCTRAQSVTFLYRAAGSPAVIGSAEFSDVESDTYYAAAVAWAAKNGITSGTGGGQFGSDDECSRGHIVTFLFNAYGK